MGAYGLLKQPLVARARHGDARLALSTIWVLKQASDKLPWELDEAARIDGARRCSSFAWSTCRS